MKVQKIHITMRLHGMDIQLRTLVKSINVLQECTGATSGIRLTIIVIKDFLF